MQKHFPLPSFCSAAILSWDSGPVPIHHEHQSHSVALTTHTLHS
jgi:hypothetical protein